MSRRNNFDLLRHVAALLVLWYHSFLLSATSITKDLYDPLGSLFGAEGKIGATGVNIFFLLSGYLIASSWLRKQDFLSFSEARLLRIFPGLIVSVLLCTLIIGPIFTVSSMAEYASHWSFRWFIVGNITMFLQVEELSGLFLSNPHPVVVNGALWTLPKELIMYGVVLVAGIFARGRFAQLGLLVVFALFYVASCSLMIANGEGETVLTLTRVGRYFCAGVFVLLLERSVAKHFQLAIFVLCVAAQMLPYSSVHIFTLPLAMAMGFIFFANHVRIPVLTSRWKVDLSYGLYIFGYPIQQAIASVNPSIDAYTMFLISAPIVAAVAWLSWSFVEEPCLNLKGRFSARSRAAAGQKNSSSSSLEKPAG